MSAKVDSKSDSKDSKAQTSSAGGSAGGRAGKGKRSQTAASKARKAAVQQRRLHAPLPAVLLDQSKALALSKEQLLATLDTLPYAQRAEAAGRLGHAARDSPKLAQLIATLRTHPAPRVPVVAGDAKDDPDAAKGVTLPTQQKSTAHYYNEDQFALTAAVHATTQLATIKDELAGPSKLFSQLAITTLAKQEKSDDALAAIVQGASPKVYRKFVAALLRFRRTAVCEKLWDFAAKRYGTDAAARLLHGCSDAFVTAKLAIAEVRNSASIRWEPLAKSHPKCVLELIRADVASVDGWKRPEAWAKWSQGRLRKVFPALVQKANALPALWQLAMDYPQYTWDGETARPSFADATRAGSAQSKLITAVLPNVFVEHFDLLVYRMPQQTVDFLTKTQLHVHGVERTSDDTRNSYRSGQVRGNTSLMGLLLAEHYGTPKRFEQVLMAYVNAVFALATRESFYSRATSYQSLELDLIDALGKIVAKCSVAQGKAIVDVVHKLLVRLKPEAKPAKPQAVRKADAKDAKADTKADAKADAKADTKADAKDRRAKTDDESGEASDDDAPNERRRGPRTWDSKGPNGEPLNEWDRWRTTALGFYGDVLNALTRQWQRVTYPFLNRAKGVHEREQRNAKQPNPKKAAAIHAQVMTVLNTCVIDGVLRGSFFEATHALEAFPGRVRQVTGALANSPENIVRFVMAVLDAYPVAEARMALYKAYAPLQSESLVKAYARANAAHIRTISDNVKHSLTAAFQYLHTRATDTRIAADAKAQAELAAYVGDVANTFVAFHKTDPMRWTPELTNDYLHYLPLAVVRAVYASYTPAQLQQLARTSTQALLRLLRIVGRPHIDAAITQLLEPDVVAQEVRDELVAFQAVENKAVWKEMTKAADSNNVSERAQAFTALFGATLAYPTDETYLKRALELVRRKIKNESNENRAEILQLWLGGVGGSDRAGRQTFASAADLDAYQTQWTRQTRLLNLELLPVWQQMLEDALESQDLDLALNGGPRYKVVSTDPERIDYSHLGANHNILRHFHALSILALRRAAALRPNTSDDKLFDFGVELQWRIAQFRLGERMAALHFRIDFGSALRSRGQRTAEPGSVTYRSVFGKPAAAPSRRRGGGAAKPVAAPADRYRDLALVELPVDREAAWLSAVVKAYTDRVVPHFKDALTPAVGNHHASDLFQGVLHVLGRSAVELKETRAFLSTLLDSAAAEPKDHDGLAKIDSSHAVIAVFEPLCRLFEPWHKVDLCRRYHDVLLRSRQARRVLWPWAHAQTKNALVHKDERKFVRDDLVHALLAVSPSAIHLKFVWRHLMRYHQHKLDPFINAQKAFRGVFYVAPADRARPKAAAPAAPVRSVARRGGRGGGRGGAVSVRATVSRSRGSQSAFAAGVPASKQLELQLTQEKASEDAIAAERKEKNTQDFEEYFQLPGCFGLHKLLPRQCQALAKQRLATVANANRDIPSRVTAVIHWTLLPVTTYADIVDFVENQQQIAKKIKQLERAAKEPAAPEPEADAKKADAKKKDDKKKAGSAGAAAAAAKPAAAAAAPVPAGPQKSEAELKAEREARAVAKLEALKAKKELFPVNLLEAAIKGVMFNDEVLAPLSWLLSAKFLGSDQARVAIYSISAFLPYMQPDALTQLARLVLSGKRRQNLKVTAYKEMIRLLESTPIDAHLQMIANEWKRDLLHRDVRIVIINAAVGFFRLPEERGVATAWAILDSAARSSNTEIQTALLGPTPGADDVMPGVTAKARARQSTETLLFDGQGLVNNRRLLEHLESRNLRKVTIPAKFCERYAKTIVLRMAQATEIDDDVRHLAIFCLADWLKHGVAKDAAAEYLKVASDVRVAQVLCNPKPQLQAMHNTRFAKAVTLLYKICHVSERNTFNVDHKAVATLIATTLDECKRYAAPKSAVEREARTVLFERARTLLSSLPTDGYRHYFSAEDEKTFVTPYKVFDAPKGVFWSAVMERRNAQLNRFEHPTELTGAEAKAYGEELVRFLQELFDGAVTGDLMSAQAALAQAKNMLQRHVATYVRESFTVQQIVVDRLLKVTNDSYSAAISDSKQSKEIDLNRYVAVFRETTLAALQLFPTTIAKCLPSLRAFLKQMVECYALQQHPTHTSEDIVTRFTELLTTILKQFSLQNNGTPLIKLDEYSTAIIRDVFTAVATYVPPSNDDKKGGGSGGSGGAAAASAAAASKLGPVAMRTMFDVYRALALSLMETHADYLILAGVPVIEFLGWAIADAAPNAHVPATFARLFTIVHNLVEDVQTLEMKRSRSYYSDAKPKRASTAEVWMAPAIRVFDAVFRGTTTKVDPLPFEAITVPKWTGAPAFRFASSELQGQLLFHLALRLWQQYPALLVDTRTAQAVYDLVHEAALYMTLYPTQLHNVQSGLQTAISAGVRSANTLLHDLEHTLTGAGGAAWTTLQTLVHGLSATATQAALPVLPAKPRATSFFVHAVAPTAKIGRPTLAKLQDSHAYRHVTGRLALDTLTAFAHETCLNEEVMPAADAAADDDDKKKPDSKEAGDGDDDEEEEKPKKPKKKPVPEVWQVWRPELLTLLDALSAHADALIRNDALSTHIRNRA